MERKEKKKEIEKEKNKEGLEPQAGSENCVDAFGQVFNCKVGREM